MSNNFSDIRKVFSAATDDQSEVGTASRGIAGDLSKLIGDIVGSTGYLTTQDLQQKSLIEEYNNDLVELENDLAKLQERYTKQFASMNSLIDELNNTKDNLISSFENLPFTNKD